MNRKFRKMKNLSLIIFLVLFIGVPAISNSADKVRVVEGLIENVTYDSIEVNGKYYIFTGIPLKDASEEGVSRDQLKIGRKVAIFLRGESITTIFIDDKNILE